MRFCDPSMVGTHATSFAPARKVGILINVEHVRFNPFTFEVNLESLALLDSNAAKALSIGHIYLNYDPSALFKKSFRLKRFASTIQTSI